MECANCHAEIPTGGDSCSKCGWQVPGERIRFTRLNEIFAGRYDFLRLLGIGGFAEVYLAKDVLLEREVAIKILLPQHAQDAQTVERFLREAKLYAKLEHKNIIPIYDTGILQHHVFITMKYICGESLKHALSRQKRIDPRLLPVIVRGVAQALAYIHRQGIVHRDIKPANIIVEKTSQAVYLADFGIARAESSQTLTQTGMIVGTPHYLSPEQIQGKKIDQRSDIYALGASLYELATGQPPFQGDSPLEILYQHINESAEPLARLVPDIDPVIERIIFKCIEKNPARRFQKADEIVAVLEKTETPRAHAMGKTVLTTSVRPRRGHTVKALTGAVLLTAMTAGAYFLWLRPRQSATPTEERPASVQAVLDTARKQPAAATSSGPSFPGPVADKGQAEPTRELEPPSRVVKLPEKKEAGSGGAVNQAREPVPRQVPAAAPFPGTVRFSSFPPLADVFHKGEKIGNTEQMFEKDFPPGEYSFAFTIQDYQSVEVKVTVVPREKVGAHHRFPPFRSFTITARPFGRIQIDGRDHGDTPQTVKLAYGEHLVRVSKDGYRAQEQKIFIDPGAKNSVFFELEKEEKK